MFPRRRVSWPTLLGFLFMFSASRFAWAKTVLVVRPDSSSRSRRTRWYHLFHWSSTVARSGQGPDIDERDALRSLRNLLTRIPDRERQAFLLRYVQDLSPTDVAQALDLPLGTAKRAIAEGRRRVLLRAQQEPALARYLRSDQECPR